jgi:hypothetical protein
MPYTIVSAYSEKCFAAARPNDTLRSSDQNSLFGYIHKTVHVRPWPKPFELGKASFGTENATPKNCVLPPSAQKWPSPVWIGSF